MVEQGIIPMAPPTSTTNTISASSQPEPEPSVPLDKGISGIRLGACTRRRVAVLTRQSHHDCGIFGTCGCSIEFHGLQVNARVRSTTIELPMTLRYLSIQTTSYPTSIRSMKAGGRVLLRMARSVSSPQIMSNSSETAGSLPLNSPIAVVRIICGSRGPTALACARTHMGDPYPCFF